MMITLVLSSNMKKMLKENVLVKKLVGIETAGSLNVLLTDKTGTITKGKLEVIEFFLGNSTKFKSMKDIEKFSKLSELLINSIKNNTTSYYNEKNEVIGGNNTERALLKYINHKNVVTNHFKVIPFDSKIKYSLSITNNKVLHIKGAYEKIVPYCNMYYDELGNKKLLNKELLTNKIKNRTNKGERVIVVATKENVTDDNYFNDLVLVGVLVIKDELRSEAKRGIELVSKAGINIIMITGDAKETANYIGKEINLIKSSKDLVLTSEELNHMSDIDIKNNFNNIKVIARALPSDKSRLVRIAEELDFIVGMTGDGVNDAPALKKANVGFAMGSGTEVTKEAADIVILDDNIMSISKAILFGRTIFKSIRKFLIFQLTVNMCALFLSIIGPFIGINVPITIVQMLWLNMIMDTFAGIAFSKEAPLEEYMNEKPKNKKEQIINKYMYSQIIFTGLYSALLCVVFLKSPWIKNFIRYDFNDSFLMTAYFSLFIFIGIFNAFNARTEKLNLFDNIFKNKTFIFIIIFIIIVQIFLIYNGGEVFRTYGLNLKELIFVILLASTVIPFDLLRKLFYKKTTYFKKPF